MPRFTLRASRTLFYTTVVEADSLKQAEAENQDTFLEEIENGDKTPDNPDAEAEAMTTFPE